MLLAKAIVANDGGLSKYINYASKWKTKEEEWHKTINFVTSDNFYTSQKQGKGRRGKGSQNRKPTGTSTQAMKYPSVPEYDTSSSIKIPTISNPPASSAARVKTSQNSYDALNPITDPSSKIETEGRDTKVDFKTMDKRKRRYKSKLMKMAFMSKRTHRNSQDRVKTGEGKRKVKLPTHRLTHTFENKTIQGVKKESNLVRKIKELQKIRKKRMEERAKSEKNFMPHRKSYVEDYQNDQGNVLVSLNKHIEIAKNHSQHHSVKKTRSKGNYSNLNCTIW